MAWHMANTMNVHLRKKDQVTVNQLLGIAKKMSREETTSNVAKAIEFLRNKKREREGGKGGSNEHDSKASHTDWTGLQGNESWI